MDSSSTGLKQRRRGAGGDANSDGEESTNKVSSPTPPQQQIKNISTTDGGHPVVWDPSDVNKEENQPFLTLMEEILLLGLKDKQVGRSQKTLDFTGSTIDAQLSTIGLPFILERQYLLRASWLYCAGASFPRSNKHAERFFPKTIPASG
jgi:hypothetical protein